MPRLSSKTTFKTGAPPAAIVITLLGALLVGYLLTIVSAVHSFLLGILLLVFLCVFLWPEAGLYLVIFSMLRSPEIIAGDVADRATLGRGFTLRQEELIVI